MLDFEHARHHMVNAHITRRGVRDRRVLDAMRRVPRERFVEQRLVATTGRCLSPGSHPGILSPTLVGGRGDLSGWQKAGRRLQYPALEDGCGWESAERCRHPSLRGLHKAELRHVVCIFASRAYSIQSQPVERSPVTLPPTPNPV